MVWVEHHFETEYLNDENIMIERIIPIWTNTPFESWEYDTSETFVQEMLLNIKEQLE